MSGGRVADASAQALLENLGYGDDQVERMASRASLLNAASRFRRIFAIRAPDAPNLVVLGADVDPAEFGLGTGPVGHVAGTGLTLGQAFESCVGEGVEYASQFATTADRITLLTDDEALAGAPPSWHELWNRLAPHRRRAPDVPTGWVEAALLADGEPIRVPADLCFRRPAGDRDLDPPWPLSTGTAAGADPLGAALHGLLELVERDAVALWWRGGRPARVISDGSGSALIEHLRGGPSRRRSWLLDVTSDVGVPVVVAVSCHDDGFGVCCGFAARPTQAQAAEAAVREMAQMELAHYLSEMKRQTQGEAALNALDRRHIERFERLDVRTTRALHPVVPPAPAIELPSDGAMALGVIRQRLETLGLPACALNLTRAEIGVPVVRILCPGLQPDVAAPPGPRLAAAAAESGVDPACAVLL